MKLNIKKLGAVEYGSIDLTKRFNLLCGPNGTGKTYFAFVVYGLLKTKLHVKGNEKLAEDLLNNKHIEWEINFQALLEYREAMRQTLINNLDDVFGLGEKDCLHIFPDFDLHFDESDIDFTNRLINESIEITDSTMSINLRIIKKNGSKNVDVSIEDDTIPSNSISNVRFSLQSTLFYHLCLYPIHNVMVFPVERNSIYTFSKELSIRKQEAVDSIQMMIDKNRKYDKFDVLFNTKRYPLPIKDGLVIAEDLVERKKEHGEFFEFAEIIESELLKGKVQISNDGEIQFKPQKANGRILPIQMSASIIKTMSSLVVYLKHIAKRNDLIIIDEPEINLHPDNQILLTRLLARLMNKGFRLMVSTHSDYIIREINNLVIMSHTDIPEIVSIAKKGNYIQEEFIKKEDLNVLVFSYKNKTSRSVDVSRQIVDEFGFDIKSIDTVIENQTELAEKLYYALKYPKHEWN